MLQRVDAWHIVLQLIYSSSEGWDARGLCCEKEPAHGAECDERSEYDRADAKESHLALREDERAIRQPAFALHVDDHRACVRRVDVPVASLSGSFLVLSHHPQSSSAQG